MALKLDSLVGDIEDAVSSSVTGKLKSLVDNSEVRILSYCDSCEGLLDSC
jgi:hypothetical protein